ncbi:MAG: B12-binding domain-containing radical SAM protein [Bacillota bacterium]
MGLAHVAAALRHAGHRVWGCDLAFEGRLLPQLVGDIRPELVGITVRCDTLGQLPAAVQTVQAAYRSSGARLRLLVLGGPGISTSGPAIAQVLRPTGVPTAAVIGEGETPIVELARALSSHAPDLPPGAVTLDEPPPLWPQPRIEEDLSLLPPADYTLFPVTRYNRRGTLSLCYPYAPMVTSRGCVHDCPFCAAPRLSGGKWRPLPPLSVVREMERLRRLGILDIHIEDDDFLHDAARVEEICARLRARGLDLVWECMNGVRPDHLTSRLVRALANGGCVSVTLGIETLNPAAAGVLGRAADEPHLKQIVAELRSAGLVVGGYFMLGLPGESLEDACHTVATALRLGLDLAQFSIFQPVPGSAWEGTKRADPMQLAQLCSLRRRAYLRFYLRPQVLARLARRIDRHTVDLILRRALRILGGSSAWM